MLKIRLKMINGWRTWHKWWSTKFEMLAILVLSLAQVLLLMPEHILYAWSIIPYDIKQTIPVEVTIGIGIFLIIAASLSKLVRQRKPHERAEQDRQRELSSDGNSPEHAPQPPQSANHAQERGGGEEQDL